MLSRRAALASLAMGAATLSPGALASAEIDDLDTRPGLAALAAQRRILYGCAASTFELQNDRFVAVLTHEAKLIVPEYEMKRAALEPQPGRYAFAPGDALVRFAHERGLAIRGHTLVWHKANPPWLEQALSTPRKEQILTSFITDVVSRYRGQMHSWDVVNEALSPSDGRGDHLRQTLWLKALGSGYIDLAFHAARAADPHALLVYNDWGCEGAGPQHDRFRAATLDFLERAKTRGVPIGAYGMQGHLSAFGPPIDQRKLREFLSRVQSLGLRILITEHDVDDAGGISDLAVRDQAVADASRRFLDVVLENNATIGVLTWGLSDRFLDPPGFQAKLMGYSPRMLPLDDNFRRKPMWRGMAEAFSLRGH
ncbi:MAG: endo-1,4-beta-xylanase [Alphaproteobacteria bacterium]|nr:endo-1,4-beta-xylanase [Alphaproteobacteria bacterium]